MSSPPYMKLWVAEYLADTTHLSRGEHGAYFLLLMAMWRTGGKLPADDRKLAAITKSSAKEWAEIRPTILEFFQRRGGVLTHKRVAKEIAKYEDTIGKRSKAGKTSALRKSNENKEEADRDVDQNSNKSPHNQNQNHKKKEPPKPPKGGARGSGQLDLGDEPPTARPRKKPARSIPEDFPTAEQIAEQQAKAREVGADVDLTYQAERFRNWALGKDAKYADWEATWRNWCSRTIREAPKRPMAEPTKALGGETDIWRRRVTEFTRNQYWNRLDWGPAPGKPGCTVDPALLEELGVATNLLTFPGRPAA